MDTYDELTLVMRELAAANDALLQVAGGGDPQFLAGLLQRVSLLERRRNRLIHRSTPPADGRAAMGGYGSVVPLRDQVIRALHLLCAPTTGRLLTDLTKARWDERIETAKLSSLRRDELRSWAAGQDVNRRTAVRDVYVVPALSYDRFSPVRGVLALSTWETSRRLIAPLSPRVDLLRSTIALANEANRLGKSNHGEGMQRLISRLSASIPGARPFGATSVEIIAAAKAELSEIEGIDYRERARAAERAEAQLDPEALLFGAPLRSVTSGAKGDL